jgi:Domain amino terminal to FKBP-type peptidyl-prolyl isomerase
MKYVLTTMLSIGLLFSYSFAAENPALKDQKGKESYSLGYQFGQSLKVQGLDINLEVYTSGIKDALSGT